jgi:hypothetical protein
MVLILNLETIKCPQFLAEYRLAPLYKAYSSKNSCGSIPLLAFVPIRRPEKESVFDSSLLSFAFFKESDSFCVLAASCGDASAVDEPLDVDTFFKSQPAGKVKFKQVLIIEDYSL